jgi:hypothetical protein
MTSARSEAARLDATRRRGFTAGFFVLSARAQLPAPDVVGRNRMSGTYRHLSPGRYQLMVERGHGPAGVRRPVGQDVAVGIEGGRQDFTVEGHERVYYWWRGPVARDGVRLTDAERSARKPLAAAGPG